MRHIWRCYHTQKQDVFIFQCSSIHQRQAVAVSVIRIHHTHDKTSVNLYLLIFYYLITPQSALHKAWGLFCATDQLSDFWPGKVVSPTQHTPKLLPTPKSPLSSSFLISHFPHFPLSSFFTFYFVPKLKNPPLSIWHN